MFYGKRRGALIAVMFLLVIPGLAGAQMSTSFILQEHTLNNGGNPDQGSVLTSPSFQLSLDAIGEAVVQPELASLSWTMRTGFVQPYQPPTEVNNLYFSSKNTLEWNVEVSIGHYNIYRGEVGSLPGDYGSCHTSGLLDELASDNDVPPAGQCYFYLVTAANLLYEEGTTGFNSGAIERMNTSPCN